MKLYLITYTEGFQNVETQTAIFKGCDANHAEERFMESMADEGGIEGIRVLSVSKCRTRKASKPIFI